MWQGMARLSPGRLTYAGRFGAAHRHHHAAAQLILAVDEPLELRDALGGVWRGLAALIPPGVVHEIAAGAAGIMVFADAEGSVGHALSERVHRTGCPADSVTAWSAAVTPLQDPQWQGLESSDDDPSELADVALRELIGEEPTTRNPRHPALNRALVLIPTLLDGPVRLSQVAAATGISTSRLGHLFTEQLGLPFQAHVRWARLQRAMDHARHGATLTESAHAAGFADSAHLTRVCHEMFGLAPSHLVRHVTLVQD